MFFVFKQKSAYEMRISDWSSDVCSSDLRAAWTRLFDETMASLRFPFKGEPLTSAEVLNRLTDREEAARREAARSLGKVLGDNARVFSQIGRVSCRESVWTYV